MRKALVKWNEQPAGILLETESGYAFTYLPEYLAESRLPALSVHLPKQTEPFFSPGLFSVFYDLLTEGANWEAQERLFGVARSDIMSRLCLTSRTDTVGAITLSPLP